MQKTLAELAELVGGRLAGSPESVIEGVADLNQATPREIAFAAPPHLEEAQTSKAGALLVPEGAGDFPQEVIYVPDPRAALAKIVAVFVPPPTIPAGIAKDAHVGSGVAMGRNVAIMPCAVVDDNAVIGDNVIIYPHVYVGQYAVIGDDTVLYSNVTVREHCRIGKRCILHSSAVIGADGFGFTTAEGIHTKVPQVGNVIVEDDVEIGAHTGIDRATLGSTIIGHGTKIDNLVHVGHNCRIGANCLIVAQTGISGSTIVGDNVTFGGQVGTVGHITIGSNSVYAARSGIIGNMPEGVFCAGFPVQSHQSWLRTQAAMKHLPELVKRMHQLEKKLAKYEKN